MACAFCAQSLSCRACPGISKPRLAKTCGGCERKGPGCALSGACPGLRADGTTGICPSRWITMINMRLTPDQIRIIKEATADIFGEQASVRLFGSRVDDHGRGGDVDLMVETELAVEQAVLRAARMSARVSRSMHGRRVDVIVHGPGIQEKPIHRIARSQGVPL